MQVDLKNYRNGSAVVISSKFHISQLSTRQLRALLVFNRLINSTLELEKLLFLIVNEINRMLEAERTTLFLVDEENEELWSKVLLGDNVTEIRQPLGKGISGYVARTGEIINIPDAYEDERFNPEFDLETGYKTKSVLTIPMRNKYGKIIGCIQTLNKKRGEMFDEHDTHYLMLLSDHISIAIQNARVFEETKQRLALERDLNHAAEIQRQFLPKGNPEIPQYEIFAYHQPSRLVGGDYYDYFKFSQSVSIAVADVSGKGVPAAMLTSNLHASLHSMVDENSDGAGIVKKLNNHFYSHTSSHKFATLFWAKLNFQNHSLKYVNAGHVPPLLVHKNGQIEELKGGGLPIGIVENFTYAEKEISLAEDDILVAYSDGITEASNKAGKRFGKQGFLEYVKSRCHLSAWVLGNGLVSELANFSGSKHFEDDITLLVLKRHHQKEG